jgi:hypothetical protein
MKKLLLLIAAFSTYAATAQLDQIEEVKKSLSCSNIDTVAWDRGGFVNIGFNEGFLHNWAAGGELASISVNGIFSGHLDRLNHLDIWSNTLDMTYGLTYNYSTGFVPRKTDDRIDFTSRYSKRLDSTKNFYVTALFNLKSQFTKGFDYNVPGWDTIPTSKFFTPAYLTLALGMEYRRGSNISVFFSPLAARMTIADRRYTSRSPEGAYGVPYNETEVFQLGAYFSGRYQVNINKNMFYKTRLDLYANYLAKDTKDSTGKVIKQDSPTNISVLFDNLFVWKLSKIFALSFGTTFIYDHNFPYSKTYKNAAGVMVPKNEPGKELGWLQVKQMFTLGVQYKF